MHVCMYMCMQDVCMYMHRYRPAFGPWFVVGVKSLCSLISSLPHGLVELHLSGCALTSRGINSLSFAFSQGQNTSQNLRVLDLSENSTKGEDIPVHYLLFSYYYYVYCCYFYCYSFYYCYYYYFQGRYYSQD